MTNESFIQLYERAILKRLCTSGSPHAASIRAISNTAPNGKQALKNLIKNEYIIRNHPRKDKEK